MEKQKVVLITGCSSGMGLVTATYLAGKGYKVYASMRDLDKKNELLKEAEKTGVLIEVLQLDVIDDVSVKNAVKKVVDKEGAIDILVNNAGYGSGGFLEDFSMEEIKDQFETNFFGLIRVIQAVLPSMRKQKSGMIVNISSIGGLISMPVLSIYNASKFAVEALTESLRVELAPFGIKATAIEPGNMRTNFKKSVKAAQRSQIPSSAYYDAMKCFEKNIDKITQNVDDPILVAKAVYEAISSENPKRGYLVGKGSSSLIALKRILPNRVFEKIVAKIFLAKN
ncbi:MAG: SDR family oxidoreductase [Candidatus Paceibacterota bacterium]|jgi:short-subunit dehydrogenase